MILSGDCAVMGYIDGDLCFFDQGDFQIKKMKVTTKLVSLKVGFKTVLIKLLNSNKSKYLRQTSQHLAGLSVDYTEGLFNSRLQVVALQSGPFLLAGLHFYSKIFRVCFQLPLKYIRGVGVRQVLVVFCGLGRFEVRIYSRIVRKHRTYPKTPFLPINRPTTNLKPPKTHCNLTANMVDLN